MKCGGLHCRGCGDGGGGGAVVVAIVALILIAAIAEPAARAASDVVHVLAVALEVALITVAAAAGIGVLSLLVWAGIRVQRWRARRAVGVHNASDLPSVVRAEVIQPESLAIEPPKPRFGQAAVPQPDMKTAVPPRV